MSWEIFTGSTDEWDRLVTHLGSPSPYQLSGWAAFRSSSGWNSLRLVGNDHEAAAQVLLYKKSGITIGWGAGGPVGTPTVELLQTLPLLVKRHTYSRVVYLRVSDFRAASDTGLHEYMAAGWKPPRKPFASGQTLSRSLSLDPSMLRSSYSKNWVRNLRRGEQRGVTAQTWHHPDAGIMASLQLDTANTKGLTRTDWRLSASQTRSFLNLFEKQTVIVKALSPAGEIESIRGAVVLGNKAFDFFAATSIAGRKCYASNVALDHLLHALLLRGVTEYDFGGVDPVANKGVTDFKHGAGGTEHRYLGEHETALPRPTRRALGKIVALRASA